MYYCKCGRFAGVNIHGSSPRKFLQEYFHGALASIGYYLTITKYSQENFCAALENCERLAQRSFSCLQYVTTIHTIGIIWLTVFWPVNKIAMAS